MTGKKDKKQPEAVSADNVVYIAQEPPDVAPETSEEEIALLFVKKHGDDLRYVKEWNKWFIWNGKQWKEDKTLKVFTLARKMCRQVALNAKPATRAIAIASAKTSAAVVTLARADVKVAATIEQWNADRWLLNTPNGTVDLRTGELRPHERTDYMTKMTAVGPDEEGHCPRFLKFLDWATSKDGVHDETYRDYLRRACGYCLTGDISEDVIFFLWGDGDNGKSVFISALSYIFNDYHTISSSETFTVSQTDRHLTEVAKLHGARLVTVNETEKGKWWAEARLDRIYRRNEDHRPLYATGWI